MYQNPVEIILGNVLALLEENFQDRLVTGPRMSVYIMNKGQRNKNQKKKCKYFLENKFSAFWTHGREFSQMNTYFKKE